MSSNSPGGFLETEKHDTRPASTSLSSITVNAWHGSRSLGKLCYILGWERWGELIRARSVNWRCEQSAYESTARYLA